jgi:hypothetical protein
LPPGIAGIVVGERNTHFLGVCVRGTDQRDARDNGQQGFAAGNSIFHV